MAQQLDKALKSAATATLASPMPYALLKAAALRKDPLIILVYHTLCGDDDDVDAWTALRVGDFRQHVGFLREQFDIVGLAEGLANATVPAARPRMVITFDDGEAGLHRHLLGIVNELALPVTLYIATGQIADGKPYWFDRVMNALQSSKPFAVDLTDAGLPLWSFDGVGGNATWLKLSALLETLKTLDPERREAVTEAIEAQAPRDHRRSFRPLRPMTIDELKEVAASPHVTIGAHSHCHNLLDQVPIEQARESMRKSKLLLEEWTGQSVGHFAYPNGNWNPGLESAAREVGFRSTVILDQRLHCARDQAFGVPRIQIGRYDTLARFKLRLLGL